MYIVCMYVYQSQNLTVASARNWRVCRQGRRGQGKTGHISKAGRAKAEQGVGKKQSMMGMGIVQYE